MHPIISWITASFVEKYIPWNLIQRMQRDGEKQSLVELMTRDKIRYHLMKLFYKAVSSKMTNGKKMCRWGLRVLWMIYMQLMGAPLGDIMMIEDTNWWLHAQLKLQQLRKDIAWSDHALEDIVQAMESDHTNHTKSQIHPYATPPLSDF